MKLTGSCHCQSVRFSLSSSAPVPFMRCYCSICRKTNGGGGYAINLGGDFNTLEIDGRDNISVYRARIADPSGAVRESTCERSFCRICGSGLWVYTPDWPDLVHPFASAIDSELPSAPERTHIMLAFKAGWVPLNDAPADRHFDGYPDESLADWHARLGLDRT
jgi:hypothetical protein